MNSSNTLNELAKSLAGVQATLRNPPTDSTATVKTKTGGSYAYKYLSLPKLVDHIRDAFKDAGLAFSQEVVRLDGGIGVTTRIIHVSGQWLEAGPLALPASGGPQDYGSAITYARRYALAAAVGLAPDEDDDASRAQSVGAGPKGVGEGAGGPAPTDRTAAGEGEYGVTLDQRSHRASAPAAVTNRADVEAPRGDSTGTRAGGSRSPRAHSDAEPPAASTTPAGDPSPPRVEAPASPGDGQRGATVIPPSPGTTPEKCSHPSWKPAPRAGFDQCTVCGHAVKKRQASV